MTPGRIVTALGGEYEITAEDRLWCARMCVGEGETTALGARLVVACMVRRFAIIGMLSGRVDAVRDRQLWPSLTRLIVGTANGQRGYSQPVSFQWRNNGSPERLARRARIRELQLSEISPKIRSAVDSVLSAGALPGGPAVHFADEPTTANALRRNPTWRRVPDAAANVLVSTTGSRAYHRAHGPIRVKGRCIFGGNS